jgi:acylphosphatase
LTILKSVRIYVSGRVQGVFFRVYTRDYVRKLQDVTGYVKNLRDGRVEIFAEGTESSLKKVTEWVRKEGSPASNVTNVDENWEEIDKRNYNNFEITYR